MERRVTLIIEFPREPSNVWEVLENLWVELYRAAEWEMKRFVIGPVALYSAATQHSSVIIQSDSLHYTSSRTIWAMVIAGVPLGQRKVLWKLDPSTTMEDLSFAADEYNSTADERDRIKEILGYSEEEDRMISRWRMERVEREMRIQPATDEQWHDVRIRIQGYTYGDYNDFVSHFFTSACRQLSTAGWIHGESLVLHASTGPAHALSHREWTRVTFPDEVVARAFYYMAQNNRAEARHQTFNVEVWNPSFNAELNEPNRCNMLARWRATRAISEFTPQIAVGFFPAGTPLATLIDINEIIRGGNAGTACTRRRGSKPSNGGHSRASRRGYAPYHAMTSSNSKRKRGGSDHCMHGLNLEDASYSTIRRCFRARSYPTDCGNYVMSHVGCNQPPTLLTQSHSTHSNNDAPHGPPISSCTRVLDPGGAAVSPLELVASGATVVHQELVASHSAHYNNDAPYGPPTSSRHAGPRPGWLRCFAPGTHGKRCHSFAPGILGSLQYPQQQ